VADKSAYWQSGRLPLMDLSDMLNPGVFKKTAASAFARQVESFGLFSMRTVRMPVKSWLGLFSVTFWNPSTGTGRDLP